MSMTGYRERERKRKRQHALALAKFTKPTPYLSQFQISSRFEDTIEFL
jgi:hypothetical protein